MPVLHSYRRILAFTIAGGVCWALPSQVQAQIGKVDARYVEPAPCGWSFLPKFDFHSICFNGICPSCKRRYCPLESLTNFGYAAPRWQPFPGTNPNYTPKKKDVGISVPAPLPTTDPTKDGAVLRAPANKPTMDEPPLARIVSQTPITPIAKPMIMPDIKPDDGDQ